MGRTRRLIGFIRQLLEGRNEQDPRPAWILESVEKVLSTWPADELARPSYDRKSKQRAEHVFAHLRRLYRYGFRLNVADDGWRLRQFFADGTIYRPEGYSSESAALLADMSEDDGTDTKKPMQAGQCRIARAKPVLKALGFPDLESANADAIQFAAFGEERWIFIDSRPELFRLEAAAAVAARLARDESNVRTEPRSRLSRGEGPPP